MTCADSCESNMGEILLAAGDLVSAYRYFLPAAQQGDVHAISRLVEISERGGDTTRASEWRRRLVPSS